jgi:hypothetical protein
MMFLVSIFFESNSIGRRAQEDASDKMAIAEKMADFGRELESEGVEGAGMRLVRKSQITS